MGNSASSGRGHHEEMVDFGYLTPQGIYTGPRDWNQAVVNQLIVDRKLAPFYRPLEEYDESWDDEQILAARKEPPEVEGGESSRSESISLAAPSRGHQKRPSNAKEPARHPEAAIYRGAIECPICFLYYPPNINRSRCCDQAICTECFVQIKRADPTTTHLVSEPASCPYCVQENFGIVYTPPPWRAGLGSEGATPPSWPDSPRTTSQQSVDTAASALKRRRKSFGANDPDVVTVDQIHPDWEAKLASVRAAVARRANRRIIMRQVGDRLIPVGVTSGRVHAIPPEEVPAEVADGSSDRGSRRSRRRQQNQELNQFLGTMGLGGQDLEELMVMEAMRLSLLEHEAQQRRQQEEEAKRQREEAAAGTAGGNVEAAEPNIQVEAPEETVAGSTDSAASQPTTPEATPTLDAQDTATSPSGTPTTSMPEAAPLPPTTDVHPSIAANSAERQLDNHGERVFLSSPHDGNGSAVPGEATRTVTDSSVHREASDSDTAAASVVPPVEGSSRSESPTPASTEDGSTPALALPSSSNQSLAGSSNPALERLPSLSSSHAPSSYDVLPSSPDSTTSNKPLLDSAAPATSTPAVDGDTLPAAA